MMQLLKPKRSTETTTVWFNFASALGRSETLADLPEPTATVEEWTGGVSVAPTILWLVLAGTPQSIVKVTFSGGTSGRIYKTVVTAETSSGNTVQITAYLPVMDDPV